MRKSTSKSSPGSSTPASASAKKLRYKNLRYGCKLCPNRVFSQLAAPANSRTRESAVEGHVRRHHPQESQRWRRVAYRWGVRAYYTDSTTADIRNPSELPPVMEDEDTREEDEDDASGDPLATSGYVYADEQYIDAELRPEPETDRKDNAGGQYIKTENGDVSVWQYLRDNADASNMQSSAFDEQDVGTNTPGTGYTRQTTPSNNTGTEAAQPPAATSYNHQGVQSRPGTATQERLLPPIQLLLTPYTSTMASYSMSLQADRPTQTSYFQSQPQAQVPSQTHFADHTSYKQLQYQSCLSNFDNGAIAGLYGQRMARLAEQVFLVQHDTREERIHLVGQYLQETRKVLITENERLWEVVRGQQERYGSL